VGNDTRGTAKIKQALLSSSCEKDLRSLPTCRVLKLVIADLGLIIFIIKNA